LIDVVIVTARGSWELLHACLCSLETNGPERGPLAIHVVDNASGDGTVEAVSRRHREVAVEALSSNRGFAHACNRAISRGAAPFVMLLNPDTLVGPGVLDRLLETLELHPRAAACGPRLIGTDGAPDHNAKRSFPTVRAAVAHFVVGAGGGGATGPTGYARTDINEFGSGAVDAISGSCMLVRRSAVDDVGLLDEGYWMYGEDLDWCRRFGQRGWEVRYLGAVTVLHVKHGTTGRHRTLRLNWAFHRAMGRFYRRFDAGANPAIDVAVYTGVLLRFAVSAVGSTLLRNLSVFRVLGAASPPVPTADTSRVSGNRPR
jgi:N-acetylglucosaminyl-diphospho-decaprenol L-rhamnosyltransferase